jgi:3'(2'), 5'-bisphosphate nucleotidase
MAKSMNKKVNKLLILAIRAAVEAGKAILEIYNNDFEVAFKEDDSPLTKADLKSNKIICQYLEPTEIPIISEENKAQSYLTRKSWDYCWLVDPLDGTKEFVKRNGEFTVNIALIKNEQPILGVIFVPHTRVLYYGDVMSSKATKTTLNELFELPKTLFDPATLIQPFPKKENLIRVVGSRSHMSDETTAFIEGLKNDFNKIEIVSKGSSLKFCLVAEGSADIYPRFGPTMEWDTAAGQAICEAVGLKVISLETQNPLIYNKENLLNSYFTVE